MIRVRSGRSSSFLILALGIGLAGCNANSAPVASAAEPVEQPAGQPAVPQAAPVVALPPGAACTGMIQRWRTVIESDYRTGYVDPPVYGQAEKDIAQAQSVCAAGRDADAVRLVQESRRRHGYPSD
jgi:hypothetical protein